MNQSDVNYVMRILKYFMSYTISYLQCVFEYEIKFQKFCKWYNVHKYFHAALV